MTNTGQPVPSLDPGGGETALTELGRLQAALAELTREVAAARAQADHLEFALRSNRRIGIAIGLVMAEFDVTDEAAFEILRQRSMRTNGKLVQLAEQVVGAGRLEGEPQRAAFLAGSRACEQSPTRECEPRSGS